MGEEDYLPGVALITGSASGIGRGAALAFAKEGCTKIFLADINEDGLVLTKNQILTQSPGVTVEYAKVDISSEKSVKEMVAACVTAFFRIDYACNLAAIIPPREPITETDVATYDAVIDINETGTWFCHRAEIAQMLSQSPIPGKSTRGSIISTSSIAGINASPGVSPYASTKHAIIGLIKTDAQDYGPYGIRVNAVCPGVTDTEAFRKITPAGAEGAVIDITPLRRLGQPGEVGVVMAFLSSEKAAFMTGSVVVVDGGLSLQRKTPGIPKAQAAINHVS